MDCSEKPPNDRKSANPNCFKNVKTKPVEYELNNKAWMTSEIFQRGFRKSTENSLRKTEEPFYLLTDN